MRWLSNCGVKRPGGVQAIEGVRVSAVSLRRGRAILLCSTAPLDGFSPSIVGRTFSNNWLSGYLANREPALRKIFQCSAHLEELEAR